MRGESRRRCKSSTTWSTIQSTFFSLFSDLSLFSTTRRKFHNPQTPCPQFLITHGSLSPLPLEIFSQPFCSSKLPSLPKFLVFREQTPSSPTHEHQRKNPTRIPPPPPKTPRKKKGRTQVVRACFVCLVVQRIRFPGVGPSCFHRWIPI